MTNWSRFYRTANKSEKSMMSNSRGHQHELLIEGACRYYKAMNRAYIVKEAEPFRVMTKDRANGTAKVQFTKHAQPDFHGTLKGGRAIVFEAKFTDTPRIKQDVISQEQADSLNRQMTLGAACFVCVGIQLQAYMVPWHIFSDMKSYYGHKYADAGNLEEWRVNNDGVIKFLDYYHRAAQTVMESLEMEVKV